jgi:hypothetical protein
MKSTLKEFMTESDRKAVGDAPTLHAVCMAATGRARPGKTARDKRVRDR